MLTRRQFLAAATFGSAALARAGDTGGNFANLPIGTTDPKLASQLAAAGYGYLELSVGTWLDAKLDAGAFAAKLAEMKALPLPVAAMNGFLPKGPEYQITGPEAKHAAILEWGNQVFPRAKAAGVEVITFGSGANRKIPENFDKRQASEQFSGLLGRLAQAAHDAGVILTIENLNTSETNLGNTLAECLALVEASGSPHMKLTHDIYHSLRENEPPAVIEKAAARIVHCHVAEKDKRSQPGVAGDDFRPYLSALAKAGYAGRFTFECTWVGGMDKGAAPAIQAFRAQMR